MKANWKLALMCAATLAFFACNKDKEPVQPTPTPGGDTSHVTPPDTGKVTPPDPKETYTISVTDNSIADWEKLPAEYVASAVCPDDAMMDALKSAKVFADEVYIYVLVEYDPEQIVDREWPSFHVYLDADNSDLTGGYSDQFLDPNADVLLETAIFASGEPNNYNPGVFKWWGEVGGEGWNWTEPGDHSADDNWGAVVGEGALPIGNSQILEDKYIEISLLRELIPAECGWNNDGFGIGFDIQQNWSSVGIMPIGSPTDENPNGLAAKMKVKIYK